VKRHSKSAVIGQDSCQKPSLCGGKVGIFWWFRGRLLSSSVPLSKGVDCGQNIDSPLNHCNYWRSIQQQHPELQHFEYDDIPRGRVLFSKQSNKFYVYMDVKLHKPRIKHALCQAFCLPENGVIFDVDLHYTTDKKKIDELLGNNLRV
jgi:hypothetical protein